MELANLLKIKFEILGCTSIYGSERARVYHIHSHFKKNMQKANNRYTLAAKAHTHIHTGFHLIDISLHYLPSQVLVLCGM